MKRKLRNLVAVMSAIAMILAAIGPVEVFASTTFTSCTYLTDGAVYQANKPAGIWGTASAGTKIEANLFRSDQIDAAAVQAYGYAYADAEGKWSLSLDCSNIDAGYTEYTIHLYADEVLQKNVSGILFGEVWLSAGQSNMQLALGDSYEGMNYVNNPTDGSNDKYLKVFLPSRSLGHWEDAYAGVTGPYTDVDNGVWFDATNAAYAQASSAVSYHFARSLREQLNVPIAILDTSMGSTPIESWLSPEMIDSNEKLKAALVADGVYTTSLSYWTDMSTMYYTKIAPLSNTSIAGMIWYQGCSNVGARQVWYAEELDIMKQAYGELFGFADDSMPFIFSQLAPYTYHDSTNQVAMPGMMDEMTDFYLAHESTVGMVTNYDLSLQFLDVQQGTQAAVIHPTVKRPIGERMALSAMGLAYGRETATAPIAINCEIKNGVALVDFSNVGTGLQSISGASDITGFAMRDASGTWVNASAKIVDENTVAVYSNLMSNPTHVQYAYNDMNTDGDLCAGSGIPAAPFSTLDDATSSLGSRSYLNCDEELFVVTDLNAVDGTDPVQVGNADYRNPWTFKADTVTPSFDTTTKAQGAASLKVVYGAESDSAVDIGIDFLANNPCNSATTSLAGVKTISVQMKNGDARAKGLNLTIVGKTNGTYGTAQSAAAPATLAVSGEFQTLVFDVSNIDATILADPAVLDFSFADGEAGTVWIDDIKLGVESYRDVDVDKIISAGSVTFGEDDTYMKLNQPLTATPDAIEAQVKFDKIEAEESKNITIHNCDTTDNITSLTGIDTGSADIAPVNFAAGQGYTPAEGADAFTSQGVGRVRFQMILTNPVDISSVKDGQFEFSLYMSTVEGLSSTGIFVELTSGGKPDAEELWWEIPISDLQAGWNTISKTFASGGQGSTTAIDYTAVDCVRIYFNTGETADILMMLDNIHAYTEVTTSVKTGGGVQLWSCDYEEYEALTGQWINYMASNTAGANPFVTDLSGVEGTGAIVSTTGQVRYHIQYPESSAVDISNYEDGMLQMRVYVPEDQLASLQSAGNMTIEIATNYGTGDSSYDIAEQAWEMDLDSLNAGWTDITLPLSGGSKNSTTTAVIDYTNINYLRVYLETAVDAIMYLDNVRVTGIPSNAQMIFSNTAVEGESNTFALYVTSDGFPAVVYGEQIFTLENYSVCTGGWETLKVVKVPDTNLMQFLVNGTLIATSNEAATTVGAPTVPHCVGANGSGGQIMNGSVSMIHVMNYDGTWKDLGKWDIAPEGVQGDVVNTVDDNQLGFRGTAVDALTYTVGYFDDITEYRTGMTMTAPEKEDFVFAGWYTDASCTADKALSTEATGGAAYAKWVDNDILNVKAQVWLTTDGELGDVASMRFVTSVDTRNYLRVGFDIRINEETRTTPNLTTVYATLMALGEGDVYAEKTAAEVFGCTHATYFKAYTIRKIPSSAYNEPITVVPFWVTLDGTRVNGPLQVKTVNQVNQ